MGKMIFRETLASKLGGTWRKEYEITGAAGGGSASSGTDWPAIIGAIFKYFVAIPILALWVVAGRLPSTKPWHRWAWVVALCTLVYLVLGVVLALDGFLR